jgi:xylan 1,4-beta-xylosidase
MSNGIDKPVLNVFRMFGMMSGDRVAVKREGAYTARRIIQQGVTAEPDISALASKNGNTASVMVWNYHDDDIPTPPARIQLSVDGLTAGRVLLHHYRIDENHSNAYSKWLALGAPQQLSRAQIESLEAAGKLELLTAPQWITTKNGSAVIEFDLPHQGVSLLQLSSAR